MFERKIINVNPSLSNSKKNDRFLNYAGARPPFIISKRREILERVFLDSGKKTILEGGLIVENRNGLDGLVVSLNSLSLAPSTNSIVSERGRERLESNFFVSIQSEQQRM